MAVSTSSGFHTYSSWGRTRGPKNIIDPDHSSPTSVALTAGTATSSEFLTENQRFLHLTHIMTEDAGDDENKQCNIQVQVYMHASGQWANFGSVIASTATRTHNVVEIFGVDKVRFVATGLLNDERCTIFPACSTF